LEIPTLEAIIKRLCAEIIQHMSNPDRGLSSPKFDWDHHDLLVKKTKELVEIRSSLLRGEKEPN
jgi:hypothetical protein